MAWGGGGILGRNGKDIEEEVGILNEAWPGEEVGILNEAWPGEEVGYGRRGNLIKCKGPLLLYIIINLKNHTMV